MLVTRRKKTMVNESVTYGVVGTAVGAVGAGLSVNEIQAIVSICVTVFGFIISVLIPLGVKIFKWYKKSKKDGKITEDELDELGQIVSQGSKEIKDGVESIKEVSDKNQKE